MKTLFWFDFASPNAYLAWRVLPALEARTNTHFQPVPVLLGGLFKLTGNQAPMLAFAGVPAKLAYEHLEMQRFIARHSLTQFKMNPHFPVNTLKLMRGAVAADHLGLLPANMDAMMRAMWEEGLAMADGEVWAQAMAAANLPAAEIAALADTADIKATLMANTEAAHAAGAFGIPSFQVAGELYFGKDRMDEIERILTTP